MPFDSEVCVIGAGVSGISAVKHCLEYNLGVICYEERPALGGLWTGADPKVSQVADDGTQRVAVYQSLTMNITRNLVSFSDFPLPETLLNLDPNERYMKGEEFIEYLNLYIRHFKIDRLVQLSTRVLEVAKVKTAGANSWAVTVQQKEGGKEVVRTTQHRYVIIASGFHSEALIPEIPGRDRTAVQLMHVGYMRQVAPLKDKRVLVVGGSISAGDAAEVAVRAGATKVTWAASREPDKRTLWIFKFNPFRKGEGVDEVFSLFSYRFYPFWMMRRLFMSICIAAHRCDNSPMDFKRDRFAGLHMNVMDEAMRSGKMEIIPTTIQAFSDEKHGVTLANGARREIDVCLLASGYKTTYPFLGKSALGDKQVSDLELYRYMIPVDPSLCGLVFMYTAAISDGGFCEMEFEGRWIAHQIASGRLNSEAEQQKLVSDSKWRLPITISNHAHKRSAYGVAEPIAQHMGCEPRVFFSAFFSPSPWKRRLCLAAAFGLWLPHLYRLRGPHAKPLQARDAILHAARSVRGWRYTALVLAVDAAHAMVLGTVLYGAFLCVKRLRA